MSKMPLTLVSRARGARPGATAASALVRMNPLAAGATSLASAGRSQGRRQVADVSLAERAVLPVALARIYKSAARIASNPAKFSLIDDFDVGRVGYPLNQIPPGTASSLSC